MIRFFDVVLSIIALIILSPLLLITALVILITSGRPILYIHTRIGKDRKPFKLYKFRTMVKDAHKMRELLQDKNEAQWPFFKMTNDPRITKVGKILRKTSIDELPQLINIIKGDMAIVGPRPLPPEEASVCDDRKFAVRPGLTGPRQLVRYKAVSVEERDAMEIAYVEDKHKFKTNLIIILKTFGVLFKGD